MKPTRLVRITRSRLARFALAAALFATACVTFRRPEVTFRGVTVGTLDSAGGAFDASFDVFNPNGYRIGVRRLTYRIHVNGREAGSGAEEHETVLEAKSTTLVHLPLTLDWQKIRSAGLDFLVSGGIDYAVEGEITFTTPIGAFTRPYRQTGTFSPSDLIRR
ncbi:MAG: LEA type 2 family protein [Acidobacteriota bacterium]